MREPGAWRVVVTPPRTRARERNLRLRARRHLGAGRYDEVTRSAFSNDPVEAERLRALFERELNAGRVVTERRDPSLVEVLGVRLSALEDERASPNTLRNYRSAIRLFARVAADVRDSTLATGALLRVRDEIARARRAATTNTLLGLARAAWSWAREREIVRSPWPPARPLPAKPTRKRPFTDAEVGAVLAWAREAEGGKWLPLFALLAATGGRSASEILSLRGAQVRRDPPELELVETKTGAPRVVPVPAPVMALLPNVGPDALMFAGNRPGRPISRSAALDALGRAMRALGIGDRERLDLHSLRRAWVATAQRYGIPSALARRVTGHESERVFEDYARNAVVEDLRPVVDAVHAARCLPRASPPPQKRRPGEAENRASQVTGDFSPESQNPAKTRVPGQRSGEATHGFACERTPRRLSILGRPDPLVQAVAELYARQPEALRRALTIDREAWLELLDELAHEAAPKRERRARG